MVERAGGSGAARRGRRAGAKAWFTGSQIPDITASIAATNALD